MLSDEFAFLSQPENDFEVPFGGTARFLCHPNMGSVAFWMKDGRMLPFDDRVVNFNNSIGITINDVTYSDIGGYECVVMLNSGDAITSASGNLTVQGI